MEENHLPDKREDDGCGPSDGNHSRFFQLQGQREQDLTKKTKDSKRQHKEAVLAWWKTKAVRCQQQQKCERRSDDPKVADDYAVVKVAKNADYYHRVCCEHRTGNRGNRSPKVIRAFSCVFRLILAKQRRWLHDKYNP